jgi:hypothetical protein
MPRTTLAHATKQVNVYRCQVTFKGSPTATDFVIIAATAEDVVALIQGDLDDVVHIAAPVLAIGDALIAYEPPEPPPETEPETEPKPDSPEHGHGHGHSKK